MNNDDLELIDGSLEEMDNTLNEVIEPVSNNSDSTVNGKKSFKIAILGDGPVAQYTRLMFTNTTTEIQSYDCTDGSGIDEVLEEPHDILVICPEISFRKNGSQFDDELINILKKSCHANISVILKTPVTPESIFRILGSVTEDWAKNSFVYMPEIGENSDHNSMMNEKHLLVGGDVTSLDGVLGIVLEHTNYFYDPTRIIKTDWITASYIKLSISSFKAVKQEFFNQLHAVVREEGNVNFNLLRSSLENYLESNPLTEFSIPSSTKSMIDPDMSKRMSKSYKGEYMNKDARLLSGWTDQMSILDEAINFKNLQD